MNMMYNIIEIDDMKKIIKVISIWLKNTRAEFLRRQVLKHTKEVKREATHRLQIREFDECALPCHSYLALGHR